MFLQNYQKDAEALLQYFKKELGTVRTGRASPALLDHMMIEAYGVKTPLRELASITTTDPRTLVVQPWDKNLLKDIEKGILEARIGLSPAVQGLLIRLSVPPLTEETRRDILKVLKQKLEEVKQGLRKIRDRERENILTAERDKKITEDDRYRLQKELDELQQHVQIKFTDATALKEKEIMTL